MSLLQKLLTKNLTTLTKNDLNGVTYIKSSCFTHQNSLTSVEIADSVKEISGFVFAYNESLNTFIMGKNVTKVSTDIFHDSYNITNIDLENMNPYCVFGNNIFNKTLWFANQPEESMITAAKGKVLIGNKISSPSTGFEIPDTVVVLAAESCMPYTDTVDSNFTKVVIPDTIEMVQSAVFIGQTALTQITVGSSVNRITGTIAPKSDVIKNLIFRQPVGMAIELPTAGRDGLGLGYYKDARSMNIYTDNECIKNYDWAADNVTATFYPLSEAPE